MKQQTLDGSQSASNLKQYEYVRSIGAYKPHFQGIPEEYFPLNGWQVFKYSIYVLFIIGVALGIMIGFLFWVLNGGLTGYTIAWCVTFLVFAVMMIILFYFGGKGRIREEKRLIIEQQKKQEALKNKGNVKVSQQNLEIVE